MSLDIDLKKGFLDSDWCRGWMRAWRKKEPRWKIRRATKRRKSISHFPGKLLSKCCSTTRGSSFGQFILLGEQVWQPLSSAASPEMITPPAFADDARLLLRLNQSTDNQGKKLINQPTGMRITSVWSVLSKRPEKNHGKSAISGRNVTDTTLPKWPLTGLQSIHTSDSTYERFNCYSQQSCKKKKPQSHMRKYCSEGGKWWKTKLPLNQHLPCESTYLRASIWPKSNTPT